MSTVKKAFDEFVQSLEISVTVQNQAAEMQKALREKLKNKWKVKDDYLSGSYRRHTKIDPLRDIDLVIELDDDHKPRYYPDQPKRLLRDLAADLQASYPKGKVTIQKRSVNLQPASSDFGFDIVPAFRRSNAGTIEIPDTGRDGFISSCPKRHSDIVSAQNAATGGKLVPTIKIMKFWNRDRNVIAKLRSFYVEVLTLDSLKSDPGSLSAAVAIVFRKMSELAGTPIPDPAGIGNPVTAKISPADAVALRNKLKEVSRLADEALDLEAKGGQEKALKRWAHIFNHPSFTEAAELAKGFTVPTAVRQVKRSDWG